MGLTVSRPAVLLTGMQPRYCTIKLLPSSAVAAAGSGAGEEEGEEGEEGEETLDFFKLPSLPNREALEDLLLNLSLPARFCKQVR